jgi:pyruvate/2-oxoglutarate/acetoin dehydrogenase E1 component
MQRVGVPDTPIPFSRPLEQEVVPGAEELHTAIDRIV